MLTWSLLKLSDLSGIYDEANTTHCPDVLNLFLSNEPLQNLTQGICEWYGDEKHVLS